MTSVYISGPMRGLPKFNFPEFDEAEAALREAWGDHYVVHNPAAHDREIYPDIESWEGFDEGRLVGRTFDMPTALKWDLARVIESDRILMLPGWENSAGAVEERRVAELTGVWIIHAWRKDGRLAFAPDPQQIRVTAQPGLRRSMGIIGQWGTVPSFRAVKDAWTEIQPSPASRVEMRIVDPTTGGAKGQKLARFDLVPAGPLQALAEHYGRGAAKYEERNWEKGYAWSLSFAALMRHAWAFWGGETVDPETGSHHGAAIAFHAFALMEFAATHPELDDRVA